MGTMYAQLVCAASMGNEQDACPPVLNVYYAVMGSGCLTIFVVYELAGTVHEVRAKGKRDDTLFGVWNTIEYCFIFLLYRVVYELLLQVMVILHCASYNEQS